MKTIKHQVKSSTTYLGDGREYSRQQFFFGGESVILGGLSTRSDW